MGAAPYKTQDIAHTYKSFYELNCSEIEGVECCAPEPSAMDCFCRGRSSGANPPLTKTTSACLQDLTNISFAGFKGKVVLIVNVASNCHSAQKNYEQLNALYSKYHEKGLEILAFPCNQFGKQEPGGNSVIRARVDETFCPLFTMCTKVDVNGTYTHDVYKFLRSASLCNQNEQLNEVSGNFTKFVVDSEGKVVFRSNALDDPELLDAPDKLQAWLEVASAEDLESF